MKTRLAVSTLLVTLVGSGLGLANKAQGQVDRDSARCGARIARDGERHTPRCT